MTKQICSCCGFEYDIDDLMFRDFYSICPHCYWEEDPHTTKETDFSAINDSTLVDWKTNMLRSN